MQERELRHLIEEVRAGALPRRSFIQQLVGLGLTAPMASMLLMHAGVAQTPAGTGLQADQARRRRRAARCCGGRARRCCKPHFANGTKDQEGSRIFYEPLAGWDTDGNLVPILAAEIPEPRERRPRRRRQDGDLEAQARRHLARRPAVHRRRRASSPGSTPATRRPPR